MSRSYRKNHIFSHTTKSSEKKDKQRYNRNVRRKTKVKLTKNYDDDNLILPDIKDLSDPWLMSKDGKHFVSEKELKEIYPDDEMHKIMNK